MSADGEILTKASEVHGDLECELMDGRSFKAELIATDRDSDLALLKIPASHLTPIEWEQGPRPEVGQWFITPGLKELPVSVGIVSVANHDIPPESGVLGISISEDKTGPRITKVFTNSGAAKAGLKVGDIVTRVSEHAVTTGDSLTSRIGNLRPGDSLKLYILRDEQEVEVLATLGYPQKEMTKLLDRGNFQNRLGGKLSIRRAGFASIIQHDSVLAPEECGGPVVGLSGKALGLNIARGGRTESYALPAKTVLHVYEQLKAQYLASEKTNPET
jgi:serine protease Do